MFWGRFNQRVAKIKGYPLYEKAPDKRTERQKEKAKQEGSELIPHRKDGTIQNPNSYGNDPNPPKDTK